MSDFTSRLSELEKENQSLKNQVELLQSELEHRSAILSQTSSELADLQTQYQQALTRLVELKQRPAQTGVSPEGVKFYRRQINEQSQVIHALKEEVTRKPIRRHNTGATSLEQAEHQLNLILDENRALREDNEVLCGELRQWTQFSVRIYDSVSTNLKMYPDYPPKDYEAQRRVTIGLVKRLCKISQPDCNHFADYEEMQSKISGATAFIRDVQQRCNRLSQLISVSNCDFRTCDRIQGEISRIEEIVKDSGRGELGARVQQLHHVTKKMKDDYRRQYHSY